MRTRNHYYKLDSPFNREFIRVVLSTDREGPLAPSVGSIPAVMLARLQIEPCERITQTLHTAPEGVEWFPHHKTRGLDWGRKQTKETHEIIKT